MDNSVKCHSCNKKFVNIARHWRDGTCEYPKISKVDKDIFIGCLMGDATVLGNEKSAKFRLIGTNETFLQWFDDRMGDLTTGIKQKYPPGERNIMGETYDCKEAFYVESRRHPFFSNLRKWYSTGSKIFPENIILTPEILNMWYICDGSRGPYGQINIYSTSEITNCEKLNKYFIDVDIPTPIFERNHIRWNVEDSRIVEEYILSGEIGKMKGFEYKFNNE